MQRAGLSLVGIIGSVRKRHREADGARYPDEFSYRFNRRRREGELFGFVRTRAVPGDRWQPLASQLSESDRQESTFKNVPVRQSG